MSWKKWEKSLYGLGRVDLERAEKATIGVGGLDPVTDAWIGLDVWLRFGGVDVRR